MGDDNERVALGSRLKKRREYCGFSQEEVSKFLGVPRSSISLMESGDRGIDLLELRKLATLYQCTVGDLAGEVPAHADPKSLEVVARATSGLSKEDQEEVLRFAEFLKSRRRGTKPDQRES